MPVTGDLGKLASSFGHLFRQLGWSNFLHHIRHPPCLHPSLASLHHPARPLLEFLRDAGAPLTLQPSKIDTNELYDHIRHGPHASSRTYEGFLESEMVDMISKGFWFILPLADALTIPGLHVSPIGIVPQRDRRPRVIVDYSFFGINNATLKLAPPEAMQFGRALDRLLYQIWTANPVHGPVHMLKLDIADGFYRVPLGADAVAPLGVLLPGTEPLIAFPLVLPMGWTESPPFFCSVTETIVDIANHLFAYWVPPSHPLEALAATTPADDTQYHLPYTPLSASTRVHSLPRRRQHMPPRHPLAYADVFVDDEIALGQGSPQRLHRLRNVLLHVNDAILRPNTLSDSQQGRAEPISVKKLAKGDGNWSTRKILLGWLVDTTTNTISLPAHRADRLLSILSDIQGRHRVSVRRWHRFLGELRSMCLALPGGRGLFSHLQCALRTANKRRVRLNLAVQQELADWVALAHSVATRPTHLYELFPSPATYVGTHDAAKSGMGGVWFPPDPTQPCIAWRWPLPLPFQHRLVSSDNPAGDITNSHLELAGHLAHLQLLADNVALQGHTIVALGDNQAAIHWQHRGSTSTEGPAAYLLRLLALHQRAHGYHSVCQYIPGPANHLADLMSRAFHLSDSAILTQLSSLSPQPAGWAKLRHSISSSRQAAQDSTWTNTWLPFLQSLGTMDPFLHGLSDPIPVLLVLACRIRDGRASRSGLPVRAAHVRDEIHSIAKTFTRLGHPDPRLNRTGLMDPRLSDLYAAWAREDPPPTRVKPLPIQVLHHAQSLVTYAPDEYTRAVVDLAWIAFFFLLRPGEHCSTGTNHPLQLKDVTLKIGQSPLNVLTCPLASLVSATHSGLTFDTQKNRIRGEQIAHGRSGHAVACPTASLIRRVLYLRLNQATPDTPLCSVWQHHHWVPVTSQAVTATLRTSAAALPHLNLPPRDITSRSLRAGGAMAMLCGHVDSDVIRLIGRWRSDAMFRYLHAQALPLIAPLAPTMLQHGAFTLMPDSHLPPAVPPLLAAHLDTTT